jgi:carboxyl-terminal processing protease
MKLLQLKIKFLSVFLIIGFFSILILSCKKDVNEPDPQVKLNSEIMQWMYDAMDEVYYWNSTLPPFISLKSETDPETFFNKLIYTPEDSWSWLTKDYAALQAEFAGTPTSMGISPVFGKFSDSDKVFIIIAYVYPGSPAYRSGIKRGDIILKIDGQDLDTTNYSELYNQDSYSVNLGYYYNGSLSASSTTIALTAEIINSNPVVFDTILQYNESKIGYLVYVEFISGENNSLLNDFGLIIDDFKSQGITDLVVDLRYNPGGEIKAANYIGSCIAPLTDVSGKKVFVKFNYNSFIQLYFENNEGPNSVNLVNRFADNGHNLNLSRVFFLTGQNSASASELLMIGLQPYMEVVKIGEQTYGKYTGAWVLTDTNDPPKHNWAIVPIVSKYANAVGFTDFKNGLAPDYLIDDDLLMAKAFGDVTDPMLTQAVELITGQSLNLKKSIKSKLNYNKLFTPSQSIYYNLFLDKPEFLIQEKK